MADHAHRAAVTKFQLVHFHEVAQVHYLGAVNMFFMCVCENVLPAQSSANIIKKIKRVFPELTNDHKCIVTFLMNHSVSPPLPLLLLIQLSLLLGYYYSYRILRSRVQPTLDPYAEAFL